MIHQVWFIHVRAHLRTKIATTRQKLLVGHELLTEEMLGKQLEAGDISVVDMFKVLLNP